MRESIIYKELRNKSHNGAYKDYIIHVMITRYNSYNNNHEYKKKEKEICNKQTRVAHLIRNTGGGAVRREKRISKGKHSDV